MIWKWQPTPVLLPGKSHGREEPGRLQSMGPQRVGHHWATSFSFSLSPWYNMVYMTFTGDTWCKLLKIPMFVCFYHKQSYKDHIHPPEVIHKSSLFNKYYLYVFWEMRDQYFFKIFGQVTFFLWRMEWSLGVIPLLVHEKILYLYNSYSLKKPVYYLRDHQRVSDLWMESQLEYFWGDSLVDKNICGLKLFVKVYLEFWTRNFK